MTRSSVVALGVCGTILIAAPAAQAGGLPAVFGAIAGEQVYTVPAGTTRIHVQAVGASGAQNGGRGAVVDADLPVTPGETLYVEVGDSSGWNGGGHGYFGAGGGATDVRMVSVSGDPVASLASRVVVAGGGGAGSIDYPGGSGGLAPSAGAGPLAGQPGTASAGGAPAGTGGAGTLAQGGAGGLHGGAGGGGFYGGGGAGGDASSGTDSGGGAGSNHVAPDAVNTAITTNTGSPNAAVTITTGPATVVADAPVTFGAHAIGTLGVHQLTLVDTGFGPFETTGDATISGPGALDYILGNGNCVGWVSTCSIPVLFAPVTTGDRAATLSVPTSDDDGPLEVALSGTGVAAAGAEAVDAVPSVTYVTQVLAPAPAIAPPLPAAAPKLVLATCHTGHSRGKPALRCRSVSVPAGTTLPSKSLLTATLTNRTTRYATGTARTAKGITQLLLSPSRRIAPGRYSTLTLTAPGHEPVRTAFVMA
ncbi:MAG TPA: glycine-rich protein [Baekduia sp.]